jgi:hypothetical protein
LYRKLQDNQANQKAANQKAANYERGIDAFIFV